MATQTATALCELDGNVIVVCPHCAGVHAHPVETTGRLIAIPAACDEKLMYIIPETMKGRALLSAMNVYRYETERKRQQYHRKKTTKTLPNGLGEVSR